MRRSAVIARRVGLSLAAGTAFLVFLAGLWLVLASRMFVWLAGLSAYFPQPWATWLLYAMQARPDRWTRLYLIISAVVAALPVLVLLAGAVVMVICLWKRKPNSKPVYGETKWADQKQMERGGIVAKDGLA